MLTVRSLRRLLRRRNSSASWFGALLPVATHVSGNVRSYGVKAASAVQASSVVLQNTLAKGSIQKQQPIRSARGESARRNFSEKSQPPPPSGPPPDPPKRSRRDTSSKEDPNKKGSRDYSQAVTGLQILMVVVVGLMLLFREESGGAAAGSTVSFHDFQQNYLTGGRVERLVVEERWATAFDADGKPFLRFSISDPELIEEELADAQFELGIPAKNHVPVQYVFDRPTLLGTLARFLPTLLIIGMFMLVGRSLGQMGGASGIFGVSKTAARVAPETVKISFKDVAGLNEAKAEVMEFVQFLRNPSRFQRLGAKIPKGAMLVGPPGTGKTLLAKATAGEAGVPFFTMSGSDFTEMFVGVGPARVRDLFEQARKAAPCIVFLDEIDAVGRARSKSGFASNDERENTLNQLLVELDGFASGSGVVVLAGTNRPDVLDRALMRPGRFDRQISIDLPDVKGRKGIFDVYLAKINVGDVDRNELAQKMAALTPGFSGADIANVCNEGALLASRRRNEVVTQKDLEDALERVVAGLEKQNRLLSAKERRIVAYHEAGHALTGWFLQHCDPLLKVSIVPRGSAALGYAMYQPAENQVYSREELLDRMCMALGGRVAEAIHFNRISTGAADDLNRVTKMAYQQVVNWGMGDELQLLSYPPMEENSFGLPVEKPFSESVGAVIDQEVRRIVSDAYARTEKLLTEKRDLHVQFAERLLEVEMLNVHDMEKILGKRPFNERRSYQDMVGYDEPVKDSNQKESKL